MNSSPRFQYYNLHHNSLELTIKFIRSTNIAMHLHTKKYTSDYYLPYCTHAWCPQTCARPESYLHRYQQDHFIHRTVTQAFVTLTQHKASVSQEEAVSHKIEWCLWSYSTRNTCIQLEGKTTHVVNNDLKCPPTLLFHAWKYRVIATFSSSLPTWNWEGGTPVYLRAQEFSAVQVTKLPGSLSQSVASTGQLFTDHLVNMHLHLLCHFEW